MAMLAERFLTPRNWEGHAPAYPVARERDPPAPAVQPTMGRVLIK
jgi:hypothetical protein